MKSITVDYRKRLAEEPEKGHNRWHEAITPVVEAALGEEVEIQTRDAFDGQITRGNDGGGSAAMRPQPRSPADRPGVCRRRRAGRPARSRDPRHEAGQFAYTVQVPGFGFLRDAFPDPYIAKWTIKDGFAESADLPGVRIPDGSFVGVIGVAPSQDLARDRAAPRSRPCRARRRSPAARARARFRAEAIGVGGVAHDPAARKRRQSRHQAVEQRRAADAAGICRRRLVLGRRRAFRTGRRRGLRHRDRDVRLDPGPLFLAQRRGAAPRHPLSALCPRRLLFPARTRRAQALSRDDRDVGPRRRHQRERGRDVEREERAIVDDRLLVERGWSRQQAYAICSVAVDLKLSELVDVPNIVVSAFLPLDIFGK